LARTVRGRTVLAAVRMRVFAADILRRGDVIRGSPRIPSPRIENPVSDVGSRRQTGASGESVGQWFPCPGWRTVNDFRGERPQSSRALTGVRHKGLPYGSTPPPSSSSVHSDTGVTFGMVHALRDSTHLASTLVVARRSGWLQPAVGTIWSGRPKWVCRPAAVGTGFALPHRWPVHEFRYPCIPADSKDGIAVAIGCPFDARGPETLGRWSQHLTVELRNCERFIFGVADRFEWLYSGDEDLRWFLRGCGRESGHFRSGSLSRRHGTALGVSRETCAVTAFVSRET
jgi:hypothetical protein